jgi:hypothetical protein
MRRRHKPVLNMEALRAAYFDVKEIDSALTRETWRRYGDALELNLNGLYHRLKRGRRLSNAGRTSPCSGVPELESKIVQRAALEMRYALY